MNTILKAPRQTEKSLKLSGMNQYVFEVSVSASKSQIKKAISDTFKVDVVGVNTIKYQPTKIRTGKKRLPSKSKPSKKAIVTLKQGQTLPIFESQS